MFLAAGLRFVGKCNGRGETGGPLLARSPPGTSPPADFGEEATLQLVLGGLDAVVRNFHNR